MSMKKYTKPQARRAVQSIMDKSVKLILSGYGSVKDIAEIERLVRRFERQLK